MPLTRRARILLGILGTIVVVVLAAWIFIHRRGNELLQAAGDAWLSERIARLSDSVYAARLHNLRYHSVSRSLRFDSVTISTDVVRNQARTHPLPTMLATVRGGRISGIDALELSRARRLDVSEVGYDGVNILITLPAHFRTDSASPTGAATPPPADSATTHVARDSVAAAAASRESATEPKWSLVAVGRDRPTAAPGERTVAVRTVRFGNVTGRLAIPVEDGVREFDLAGFAVELDSVLFDARRDAATPFRAADVRIAARSFSGRIDAHDRLSFEGLEASVADSTLRMRKLRLEPADGDSAFFANHEHRATRTLVGFEALEVDGLDWAGLVFGTRVAVRRLEVDGFLLDLLLDKRKPANPVRKRKPSPQERVARLTSPLAIDSVIVRGATVRYAERVATAPVPGVLHFDKIDASLANVSNDPARQTEATPMRLAATARFMGRGAVSAVIEAPLLASDYRANFRVTLGRMPAPALNEVLTPLVGVNIASGELTRVRLDGRVRYGVYSGTLVPEFTDLGVKLAVSAKQKREEKGVKGFLKGAVRGAKEVAANTFVRDDNPEKPGKPPRTGKITYARTPTDSFWSGFWKSLKPALAETMVAIKM
ncbi:MAG TPA: DUF748 domain-containing protein [Gemmatimonadales bacterium]|nr:DUF748 domain-containing protein [Gemmatimonadales bacterium]